MSEDNAKVFMIAGEVSGDILGGSLMEALKPHVGEIVGIGGDQMKEQGLESLLPMDELCVMGIWEVVMQLPRLLKLIKGVVEEIEMAKPDVVVTIDLPDFNFRVAKMLRKRGYQGKIIHYVAPSVWAWRPGRALKISKFLDGLMCLFPFEPEYFEPYGLSAEYVGHPLIRQDHEKDARAFKQLYNIGEDDFVFGMYLGSREAEIQKHSEVFLEAANFLLEQNPDLQIVIPTLPDMEFDVFKAIEGLRVAPVVVSDQKKKWDAMRSCDLAMAVSGTVGLELAYMNVPHIIAYKTHPITAIIVRLLAKVKFVHLANIMVDKLIVPEFLQGRCQPLPIALELAKFLKNKDVIEEQKKSFEGVRRVLKGKMATDPADAAAQFVLGKLYSN